MHPLTSTAQLRKLINDKLCTDTDLEAFCIDYFPDIKRRFGNSQDRVQKVNLLLELADHHQISNSLHEYQSCTQDDGRFLGHRSASKLWKSAIIFSLCLALIGVLAVVSWYAFQWLSAIPVSINIEYRQQKPIVPINADLQRKPADFAAIVEQLVTKQLGADNVRIDIYRDFDVQRKIWLKGLAFIDKRTNQALMYFLIPDSEVPGWLKSIPITKPHAREIAIQAMRNIDQSAPRTDKFITDRVPEQRPNIKEMPSVQNKRTPPQLDVPLHPVPASVPVSRDEPVNVSAAYAAKYFPPDKVIPNLPPDIKLQWACTDFEIQYKICVNRVGNVSDIQPLKTIRAIDYSFRNAMGTWRYKESSVPFCYPETIGFHPEVLGGCQTRTNIALPDYVQAVGPEPKAKMIPYILIKKSIISNPDPQFPQEIRKSYSGHMVKVISSYKICIGYGGIVYAVDSLLSIDSQLSIDGADNSIAETLKTWRFKPQAGLICFVRFFELEL